MIAFEEAISLVLDTCKGFGVEQVPLKESFGRVLAEDIFADRDFPPFHRATKDGIAINYDAITKSLEEFRIIDIAAAGSPQKELLDFSCCIEIMTGAVLPLSADTVIMYEHLKIKGEDAVVQKPVKKGQNIHRKGSDEPKGTTVLKVGKKITAAEIGVLASVGKSEVLVKKNPKVCLVSTGDELVDVIETPMAHQIRKSNVHTIEATLLREGIRSESVHIKDDKEITKSKLIQLLNNFDVLLLSGGVSKGKYDYLPEVLEDIGVEKVFHKVKQRPGKPFWFGQHKEKEVTVFAFPGNPASTFANYHVYFIPWLNKCLGLSTIEFTVILEEAFENSTDLTRFIRAKARIVAGKLKCNLILGNGSGDLTSLSKANGFVLLKSNKEYKSGAIVPFIATRSIL
ncbi:molybdopterin molybdotransferase MoeA [Croceitalea sp. MTPC9]|uniref:molybdopterin molybdotransferase MoeA n=1 Tax=unclassified Croceitalea TaxID=2632280 RepID=UPI002B3E7095|nr:molybdopterin molybdotransferase MoeA [Croceitalea sp. MTPC6]GMN15726.1 molybdopterin molybdotransferase MoeA [Croceitalea sp. MTPC9]